MQIKIDQNIHEKYELIHLDTCYSDYFRGYHEPVLAIPVDGTMTANQFMDAVTDEYIMVWDYLTMDGVDDDDDDDKDGAWPDLYTAELQILCRHLLTVEGDDLVFPDLEPYTEDDDESVYCYIAINRR